MISSMVYSAYSSLTFPLVNPSSGSGGDGKQFSITRCFSFGRPLRQFGSPFGISLFDDAAEEGRDNLALLGVATPEVAREDVGVKISRRK
jgi:hypothetical protein